MEPSCPLGTTRCIPQAKFHQKPYNKSFIDQGCSVKMAGYWPRSFFCEFMDLDFVSVHKHAKKELGQYLAILTSHLVSNPYVHASVSVRYFPSVFFHFKQITVFSARKTNLTAARARKNKRSARILAKTIRYPCLNWAVFRGK